MKTLLQLAPISTQTDTDPRPDWRTQAACKGQDTNKFFPNPSDHEAANWALAWCEACPVRQLCLLSALSTELGGSGMKHGIWGGATPAERYRMAEELAKGAGNGEN